MAYVVTSGYVTVETAVGAGRAHVDIPRGAVLPGDVPAEQVDTLLRLGHIEAVGEQVAVDDDSPEPSAQDMRDWARSVGLEVNDKGRVPAAVVEAYTDAHQPQQ